jgi:hypothetical protein
MSGTQISSVTAGGFTVTGFLSNATYAYDPTNNYLNGTGTGSYLLTNSGSTPSFWFNVPIGSNTTNPFIFDTTLAGPAGSYTGAQVVDATGSSGDSWSLNITFQTYDGNTNNDYLVSGAFLIGDNGGHPTSESVYGTGASYLQSTLESFQLHMDFSSQVSLTFTLTDLNGGAKAQWLEFFSACFTAGTRIATPSGETNVEALRIGDLVATSTGVAKPVKWIGRRIYTAAQVAANAQLHPVLVRRDALGTGMPHRDLTVSAMHSLLIDDAMVPAVSLVNGVSILRSDELAPVSYFHIELADHDVVFAEGAPTETFIDDNSRLMFENADEFYDLYGAEAQAPAPMARLDEGYQLEAIRRRLAARAGATPAVASAGDLRGHVEGFEDGVLRGWAVATGSTAAVELEVIADGETVARVIANRYRLDLDHAGIDGSIGGFTTALPASVTSLSQVSVRRVVDGAVLPQPQVAALVG